MNPSETHLIAAARESPLLVVLSFITMLAMGGTSATFFNFSASGDDYASKTEFNDLKQTVSSNTSAVREVKSQVGQLYQQNLSAQIFQQTQIMCSLMPGPIKSDYAKRVNDAREAYTQATGNSYPPLDCHSLVR